MSAEIAFLVAFLASPKSLAIKGETIAADGGMLGPIIIEGTAPQRLVSILRRFTGGETQ